MHKHAIVLPLCAGALTLAACRGPDIPTQPAASSWGARAAGTECVPAVPDSLIDLPIAPPEDRVDLATPAFTNPTNVTNPLYPITDLEQVVLVGYVDGVPFRAETTLLPYTEAIDFGDSSVTTLASQYVGYLDGRIDEEAIDWYGQADDGSVWYFGEDVSNYEDGRIVDKEGTWRACASGPVAMIMPAAPAVGNVYRVENLYPDVFEEVTVTAVDQTVDGPLGPVAGAIITKELHLDATYESKTLAPDYGEFSTGSGTDLEALAVAIPIDAAHEPTPADLRTVVAGAYDVFDDVREGEWSEASGTVDVMNAAWTRYVATGAVPVLLEPLVASALADLAAKVAARDEEESRQAALNVARPALDVVLRYNPRVVVDFARLDLFAKQLAVDAQASDPAGIASDVSILRIIVSRLRGAGSAVDQAAAHRLDAEVAGLANANPMTAMTGSGRIQRLLADRVVALVGEMQ